MTVDFGVLTAEQTVEIVRAGLIELTDNDVVEVMVDICTGNECLTDELLAQLEDL